MEGFPPKVAGRVLFVDKDNLNTDGIYGSKHTYRDDITPEEMAAVTFENYDPNFNTIYRKGGVVVGGLTFGKGSSREQAETGWNHFMKSAGRQVSCSSKLLWISASRFKIAALVATFSRSSMNARMT